MNTIPETRNHINMNKNVVIRGLLKYAPLIKQFQQMKININNKW